MTPGGNNLERLPPSLLVPLEPERASGRAKRLVVSKANAAGGWEVEKNGQARITNKFKIMAVGGQATPAPPLGPVLGSKGVNPGQFIQKFNAATQNIKENWLAPSSPSGLTVPSTSK